MTSDTPIACSLTAAELPGRLAEMSAIGADALLGVDPDGVLRFRADGETRRRLEGIIAAESQCCAFLDFELTEASGELRLAVTGPADAEPVVEDLVAAFAADARVD